MKRAILAAAALGLATTTATADYSFPRKQFSTGRWASEVTYKRVSNLPIAILGEWCVAPENVDEFTEHIREKCRDSDGWMNIRPNGFLAHEMDCKLKSAIHRLGPRREFYLATFKCSGEGVYTAYYVIAPPKGNGLPMLMYQTGSKFDE